MEQVKESCDEVERIRESTFHGDRVSVGGGCKNAVTVRKRCWWVSLGSMMSCCMEVKHGD